MYRLLGIQVNHINATLLGQIDKWKPAACIVERPDDNVAEIKRLSPKTTVIGYIPTDNIDITDPQAALKNYWAQFKPTPTGVDYWLGLNAVMIPDVATAKRFAEFEMGRLELLSRAGMRAALCNFGPRQPADLSLWNEFLPLLEKGKALDAILCLQQPWLWTYRDQWTALRHRLVYRGEPSFMWPGLPDSCRLPLVITHAGWSNPNLDNYLIQLNRFLRIALSDSFVWAVTVPYQQELLDAVICSAKPIYRHRYYKYPHLTIRDMTGKLREHATKRYPIRATWDTIVLHHSETDHLYGDERSVVAMANYAVDVLDLPGIIFHYVITYGGIIIKTQMESRATRHTDTHNANTIGVCLLGDLNNAKPRPAQLEALERLIKHLGLPVVAHSKIERTTCPGMYMQEWLRKYEANNP